MLGRPKIFLLGSVVGSSVLEVLQWANGRIRCIIAFRVRLSLDSQQFNQFRRHLKKKRWPFDFLLKIWNFSLKLHFSDLLHINQLKGYLSIRILQEFRFLVENDLTISRKIQLLPMWRDHKQLNAANKRNWRLCKNNDAVLFADCESQGNGPNSNTQLRFFSWVWSQHGSPYSTRGMTH